MGGGEGKAGSVVKKKAYSKKLDFAGPSSEKASRVWLSLDTETQRVARTGPRAAPPASPAVAGGGKDSQFFVTQSPFKYQGDGLEDFFASATGSSSSSGSGSNSSSSSRVCRPGGEAAAEGKGQDAADLLLQGAEEDLGLDQQQKWEGGFEGGREGGREEGQLQAVELLTDETSRMSSCGSVDSRGLPFTPLPVNAITMNQHGKNGGREGGREGRSVLLGYNLSSTCLHDLTSVSIFPPSPSGGSNWGGIQVRVKKTTPNHTHYQHDPSLLEALAAMLPLHDDASHSPSLPTSSGSHSNSSYHSSMPPPQSPRTTTATSRGKFAPGSPVLEAMAMVTLSQSPSVFSSDRKKKKNSLRAPHSAPRVLIPSGSSIGSTSFSSLSSNITITNAAAAAAAAAAGATHPYQTPNSATKKAAHLVAAGKKNSPDSSSCSCKKSRCLKLYCECFRGGFTCGASCKCQNCANTPEFEVERAEAREKIEEKKRRKSGGGRQSLGTGEDGMVSFSMAASRPVLAETEVEEQQEEQEHQALLPMSLSHSHATRRSTRCAGVPATTTGGNIVFTLKQPSSSSSSSSSFFFSTTTMTPVQHRKGKRKNEGEEEDPIAAAAATAVLSKPLRRTTPSKGGRKDEFLLSVFGPRSKINKQNSLEVLSYLDRDDMADACLVSSLWNRLALETLDE